MAESHRETELVPRSAEETAQRILALLAVTGKVHAPEKVTAWMRKHELERFLSPAEEAFVQTPSPAHEQLVIFSWRAEAMVSLLWALNGLPSMPPFKEQFSVFQVSIISMAMKDPVAFISSAALRGPEEISEMEAFLYHQHWRVRDAELFGVGKAVELRPGDPPLEELNPGIVYERRYGMSWLVGWGRDWDTVPTDT